ncbi:MAG: ribonuclease HII [Bacteroidia bacterium]|nr:ribonuclease HII [Bacteroidia bacterium]MCF8427634.1 ribonuclease HII [Bacteroidia bacterium]MCF8447641.1 ribonuclease HII [Bacteroidia bacterium]
MGLIRFSQRKLIEAGCDEAGRGCLAGPVFAAAVILDPKKNIKGLDDSKKLNEKARQELRLEIEAKAIGFAVASLSNVEIDKYNILKSSFMAMHRALNILEVRPKLLLIDGNRFIPYQNISHQCEIKGDARFQAIAAASILAKTYRDDFMEKAHNEYPMYHWNQNKGYPTINHRKAIKEFGPCKYHRMTFRLLNEQLNLF